MFVNGIARVASQRVVLWGAGVLFAFVPDASAQLNTRRLPPTPPASTFRLQTTTAPQRLRLTEGSQAYRTSRTLELIPEQLGTPVRGTVSTTTSLTPQGKDALGTASAILRGVVRWSGPVPGPSQCEVFTDENHCGRNGVLEKQLLGVDGNSGVAGVCIYLDRPKGGIPWTDAELEHNYLCWYEDCALHPSLLMVPLGGNLLIRSDESVPHRLRVPRGQLDPLELDLSSVGARWRVRMNTPGPQRLQCRRHAWGFSHVFVAEHRYVSVSDEAGRFDISAIPPGNHRVRFWHPPTRYTPQMSHGRITGYEAGPALEGSFTLSLAKDSTTQIELDLTTGKFRPLQSK